MKDNENQWKMVKFILKKQKEKETNNEKNQNIEKTIKIMKHAETWKTKIHIEQLVKIMNYIEKQWRFMKTMEHKETNSKNNSET